MTSGRIASGVSLLVVALVAGATIRWSTFAPWGTDSSAYLDAATDWATADVVAPTAFVFWAPWAGDGEIESPFSHRPGVTKGTLVNIYPLGYPVLLAAALHIGGSWAPYLVAPLFAAVLAWCAFLLGSRLSTPWAGVAASLLIVATPVTLEQTLTPMSDVPATALWALAWLLAGRPAYGAPLAAGLSTALAVMIRPNLAPLAAAVGLAVIGSHWRGAARPWVRVAIYAASAAVGPAVLLWSQDVLYGSPFTAGYRGADAFFSADRIPVNAWFYPAMLIELHSGLALAGLALLPLIVARLPIDRRRRPPAIDAITALAIIGLNYAVMLPYLTFEGWYWLRFLLPALLALFLLLAASLDRIRLLIAPRAGWLQTAAFVPIVLVAWQPKREIDVMFRRLATYERVRLMGAYLRDALPPNAVILTYLQSGAVRFYTGRPIVRLDPHGGAWLDEVVRDLIAGGHRPVFVVDEAMESAWFRKSFAGSRYAALDWPARAEFWQTTPLLYLDAADRDAYLSGEPYETDVIKAPVDFVYPPSETSLAPPQGVPMPRLHEGLAFRRTLEAFYRDRLGRGSTVTHTPPAHAVRYTQRYLRYRIYGCSHDEAASRVFAQLEGQVPERVCSRGHVLEFPARDSVVRFRQALESRLTDPRSPGQWLTPLDIEGDAVWGQEYLRYRLGGCSPADATARVLIQVAGGAAPPTCATRQTR